MRRPTYVRRFGALGLAGLVLVIASCLSCRRASGTLQVTTTTAGEEIDPDEYTVSLDGGPAELIGVNETRTIPNVAAGTHIVRLDDVEGNCTVAGDSQAVAVRGGDTAAVTFAVTCVAAVGGTAPQATSDFPNMAPVTPAAQRRRL